MPLCTSIDKSAFASCGLQTASFPACTTIGDNAFRNCTNLLSFDGSVCSTIGTSAFYYCTSLSFVSLPICSTVASYAFCQCRNLISINMPTCTNISYAAFSWCYALPSISLSNCTSVGTYAFYMCSELSYVNLQNCTSIGTYAFHMCSKLNNVILSPSYTIIAGGTFRQCSALSSFDFTYITSIGTYAFEQCNFNFLVFSNISNSKFFDTYTFGSNFNLSYVFLNNTLSSGSVNIFNTFIYCSKLLSLYLLGSQSYYNGYNSTFLSGTPISNNTTYTGGVYGSIFVPASMYSVYISALGWSQYASRIVSLTDSEISALSFI